MITVKLDVTKIDKALLFKGEKGIYLDLVLVETPNSQYGNDYMVVQDMPKERREKGEKSNILGNARAWNQNKNRVRKPQSNTAAKPVPFADNEKYDDLPF